MCCPKWSQACNHIIGYVPGPIGSLFAIAPTHPLEWQFCHPFMSPPCQFFINGIFTILIYTYAFCNHVILKDVNKYSLLVENEIHIK